jgi:large subunit ribosomal protein L15
MERKTIIKKKKVFSEKIAPLPAVKKTTFLQRNGLHNLKVPKGAHRPKRILGRGPSSGHGKTSTRGSKGQTSRAGRDFYAGFEGGQTPLIRRMPKRGFTSVSKRTFQIVNLDNLKKIREETVTPELLQKKGLIKDKDTPVKILGKGEFKNPIVIKAHAFSKMAQDKIKSAGGTCEVLGV